MMKGRVNAFVGTYLKFFQFNPVLKYFLYLCRATLNPLGLQKVQDHQVDQSTGLHTFLSVASSLCLLSQRTCWRGQHSQGWSSDSSKRFPTPPTSRKRSHFWPPLGRKIASWRPPLLKFCTYWGHLRFIHRCQPVHFWSWLSHQSLLRSESCWIYRMSPLGKSFSCLTWRPSIVFSFGLAS